VKARWLHPTPSGPIEQAFSRQSSAALNAAIVMRGFYALVIYRVFGFLSKATEQKPMPPEPLWPVAWFDWLPIPEAGPLAVVMLAVLGAMLAIALPHLRWVRLFTAISLLELDAMRNSFGKIGHSFHLMVLIALLFALAPSWRGVVPSSRRVRQELLLVFAGAQGIVLSAYTLAGIGKLWFAVPQFLAGKPHALHPEALPRLIADRLFQTGSESVLGTLFIDMPAISWPAYLLTLYLETTALLVLLRPRLHRTWGLGLIAFHAFAGLTMTISFSAAAAVIALILVATPFHPLASAGDWRAALRDLPGVRGALALRERVRARRET
jgi:hypothetical protein